MFPSTFPWVLYAVACAYEAFIMKVRVPHNKRVVGGGLLLLLLALSHGALLLDGPLLFGIPFFLLGMYRLLNCMRFVYGRMHDEYLYRVIPRSSLVIGATQTIGGAALYLLASHHPSLSVSLYLLAVLQIIAAIGLIWSLKINLQKSELTAPEPMSDKQLPSVSVLIPARNETADLEACLKGLTASTYQKLEILVLDDCSQDRTPEVIKQFAHQGVRFVRGNEPGEVWLPKNAAYNKLAKEASGEFLLFCGVDVRFAPDDVRTLVSYAMQEKLTMVSVLPLRDKSASKNSIAQQVRYIWELALPRFLAHRPPVLSTLWLIQATALKKYGGMPAVRRNVVPEGFFARELDKKDMYRFLRAGDVFKTSSMKPPREQRDTALRVRYPQLHRRPEVVMGVTVFELAAIVGVYALGLYALISGTWFLLVPVAVSVTLHVLLHSKLAAVMGSKGTHFVFSGLLTAPVDLWLMHRSMYLYEFDEVRWKDRNVCLPVMHAIPSMPRLPRS